MRNHAACAASFGEFACGRTKPVTRRTLNSMCTRNMLTTTLPVTTMQRDDFTKIRGLGGKPVSPCL
jgi:hypothetical protein